MHLIDDFPRKKYLVHKRHVHAECPWLKGRNAYLISLALKGRKIKTNEVKGGTFLAPFGNTYLISFSIYMTPLVAFYFLHQLVPAKALKIGVASSFCPIPARVCTVMKHDPGKSENRRKASIFCLPWLCGIWVSPFKTGFQDQYTCPSSIHSPLFLKQKLFYQLVWRSRAHFNQAKKKKYFLLSSSVERQCEKIVGKDKLSKSARPVLENWFLANCNNFFWVLPMVLVPPPHFPPGCSSTVSKALKSKWFQP